MPFDPSVITDGPLVAPDGGELLVSWRSSAPAGTWFQLYVDRVLMWAGRDRATHLPSPGRPATYQVGAVLPSEAGVDFSASLPAVPGDGDRARLSWSGGAWEGADLDHFAVYSGDSPGAPVDYAAPVDVVPAAGAGALPGGWGAGGWGEGGWGAGSGRYSWTSGVLARGTWNFGVRPVDSVGNEGEAREVAVTVAGPPEPPARGPDGLRLRGTYDAGTRVLTLSWLASPG